MSAVSLVPGGGKTVCRYISHESRACVVQMSSEVQARKRKAGCSGMMQPQFVGADVTAPTRYSRGMPQLATPCVLCVFTQPQVTDEGSMGSLERSTVFEKIQTMWEANVASMELTVLAEQCAAMVSELRGSCGQQDGGGGVLDDIDTMMVYNHFMHHKSCRSSRLARLRQAFFHVSELERVAASALYVKEKGRMIPESSAVDVHRRAVSSLLALNNALTKEEAAQT